MKKFLMLFLVVFISVSSFAQERNNAIFVDVGATLVSALAGGFGTALQYERGLSENFSALFYTGLIKITMDGGRWRHDTDFLGIVAGVGMRYYPFHNPVRGWFVDVAGAYNYVKIKHGEEAISNLFELRLLTGWKFVFRPGFFLEPGIRYTFAFGDLKLPAITASEPKLGGLGLWIGIGWAF